MTCGRAVHGVVTPLGVGMPPGNLSLVAQLVKNPLALRETWVLSLGWEDPLEKGMATHSSILAWRIPWTVGSQRVGHDFFLLHWKLKESGEAPWAGEEDIKEGGLAALPQEFGLYRLVMVSTTFPPNLT